MTTDKQKLYSVALLLQQPTGQLTLASAYQCAGNQDDAVSKAAKRAASSGLSWVKIDASVTEVPEATLLHLRDGYGA
jgi:hypothetical protein